MELNYFHKIVLAFAFLILGIGIFDSVSENLISKYSDVASVTSKYDLISLESLSDKPTLLSQAWIKNMMVSSFINASDTAEAEEATEVIVKIDNPEPGQNLYLLKFPADKPQDEIINDLKEVESVSYAEPNFDLELQAVETQEMSITEKIVVPPVKTKTVKSESKTFKVGIVDSGVDKTHPRFAGKTIITKTYLNDTKDVVGHGTHLAGLIFQSAPDAEIYSYKFTDGKVGKLSGVLRALSDAKKDKVNLVNLSLGLPSESAALKESIAQLLEDEIIVVAAAGNQNTEEEFFPAAYKNVYSVGALTQRSDKLPSSNFGEWVTYSVLGQDLYSTAPNKQFKYLSGTSQSAAILSGLIANYYLSEDTSKITLNSYLDKLEVEVNDKYSDLLGTRLTYSN
jgi:subtilisin family serine protease